MEDETGGSRPAAVRAERDAALREPILENELLRTFVAVVDSGGYTNAADLLYKTQSAVSLQIKRLEERLDVELFEHPRRDIVLSKQGEMLLPHARQMIQSNQEAIDAMKVGRLSGRVRIGTNHFHARRMLPTLLYEFRTVYPDIQIILHTGSQKALTEGLGSKFDLILNFHRQSGSEGQVISIHDVSWVGSSLHDTHECVPLPVALLPNGSLLRDLATASLATMPRDWQLVYEGADIDSSIAAIAAGIAVSVAIVDRQDDPASGLKLLTSAEGFPAIEACVFTLEAAKRRLPPATLKLRDFLLERMTVRT